MFDLLFDGLTEVLSEEDNPRGWEVVNPSCGDLHRRSSSTLLPAALRVGNEKDQTLYAVFIVVLGWCVCRFFFCYVTQQWHHEPCYA